MQLLALVALLALFPLSESVECVIGYGQRGKKYSSEVTWLRTCPHTDYCFEAVTTDITKVRKLIDFAWDSYYSQYFIRSCGGDYGTNLDYHPWRGKPANARKVLGSVKINITAPHVITGHGGTAEFDLHYTCRRNLCAKVISAAGSWHRPSILLSALVAAAAVVLLSW